MTMGSIIVERQGHVTTVRLNRPHVLNAIDADMHDELEEAFNAFAVDPDQYICVVTGEGRAFCAGSDLKAISTDRRPRTYPAHGYAGLIERFDCPKPFIAAVNGVAMGGGFEVALACDIIVAGESASFGLPEPRVGAVALGGGMHRLARQIGLKQAMGMILSAGKVSARWRTAGIRDGNRARCGSGRGGDALVRRDPRLFAHVDPRVEGDGLSWPRRVRRGGRDAASGELPRLCRLA